MDLCIVPQLFGTFKTSKMYINLRERVLKIGKRFLSIFNSFPLGGIHIAAVFKELRKNLESNQTQNGKPLGTVKVQGFQFQLRALTSANKNVSATWEYTVHKLA